MKLSGKAEPCSLWRTLLHMPCREKSTCSGSWLVSDRWQKLSHSTSCCFLLSWEAAGAGGPLCRWVQAPRKELSKTGRSAGCTWLKQWGGWRRATSEHILHHHVCLAWTTFMLTFLLLCAQGLSMEHGKKRNGLGIMDGTDTPPDKLWKKSTSGCFPCLGGEGCCFFSFFFFNK